MLNLENGDFMKNQEISGCGRAIHLVGRDLSRLAPCRRGTTRPTAAY